ncbi:lamin Dm0-like [Glossina fuscipes fuscipes]
MSKSVSAITAELPHNGSCAPPIPNSNPSASLPSHCSLLQETAEMQHLNDRLAAYIDRMRNLENENARLSMEVQTARDNVTREGDYIKNIYESELSDTRRALDGMARNKLKLQIEFKRQCEQNEEIKAKLDNKTNDCSIFKANARKHKLCATDLIARYSASKVDREKAIDELTELQKEHDRLRNILNETRENVQEETSTRVNLANAVQILREELTCKDQQHKREVSEARSRRQIEIDKIGGHLSEQYEGKLQQCLQKLRNQYEAQVQANRDEIKKVYEHEMKNLQSAAAPNKDATDTARKELRCARERFEDLTMHVTKLESINADLHSRIREKEQLLGDEHDRHIADTATLEAELQRLRAEVTHQLRQRQDLMDIQVSLDLEIAAYNKFLCGEESRLNLAPISGGAAIGSPNQSLSFSRGVKRCNSPMTDACPASIKRTRSEIDESESVASALDDEINENMCHSQVGPDQQVIDEKCRFM